MKHHPRNILEQPSIHEVFRESSEEMRSAMGIHNRNTRGVRHTLTRMLLIVLTLLLVWLHLLRNILLLPFKKSGHLSAYFYAFVSGLATAFILILLLAKWPDASLPLELDGLLDPQIQTMAHHWNPQNDLSSPTYEIPPELYPETEFLSQHPFVIANISLPDFTWSDEETLANEPIAKPVARATPRPAPPVEGFHHVLKPGENLWELAKAYNVDQNKVISYNPDLNPRRMLPGEKIFIPGIKDVYRPSSSRMILPIANAIVRSGYGNRTHPIGGDLRFHRGIDIPAKHGTPVRAVLDGNVVYAGRKGQQGLVVEIEHDKGLRTVYAHNRKILVKNGQKVRQGVVISEVGSTGYSTGPHLHFEVWEKGRHKNPLTLLPSVKKTTHTNLVKR